MACLTFQRKWTFAPFAKSFKFPVPNQDIIINAFQTIWGASDKPEEEKVLKSFFS